MKIRIGTRKSKLALAQTDLFIKELKKAFYDTEDIEFEIININTKGDRIIDKPLEEIGGKGVFISEIENALLENKIDIAVHSAKDLPVRLAKGLEISGVLERGNYRDALILKKNDDISDNPDFMNFIIGTGSARRRFNMQKLYPYVSFKNIRGNIDTRLKKLENGEYNGIILAMAGLERLGISESDKYIIKPFDYNEFIPAACQGIIAVESRIKSRESELIRKINHVNTFLCFEAERHFLEAINADCTTPVGAYSEICGNDIRITVSSDGKNYFTEKAEISERFKIAEDLAKKI